MKIRIKGNSVRFRLTQSEVLKLCTSNYIEEKVAFHNQDFIYAIEVKDMPNDLSIAYESNKMTLYFSEKESKTWYDSERITYKDILKQPNQVEIALLLEKDFVCLDHTEEDQSDNYPNPNKTC